MTQTVVNRLELPALVASPKGPQLGERPYLVDQVRKLVASGARTQALKLLQDNLTGLSVGCRDVAEALIEVLSAEN